MDYLDSINKDLIATLELRSISRWSLSHKEKTTNRSRLMLFFNGTPAPKIDAVGSDCLILPGNIVTLIVSGNVTDATSDLIDTPSKQLQTVTVSWPGGTADSNLTNAAAAEIPWKPYKFEGPSLKRFFCCQRPGNYPIEIQTSENAAGETGRTQQSVIVDEIVTNIILAAASIQLRRMNSDSIMALSPSTTRAKSWRETGPSSKIFQFDPKRRLVQVGIALGWNPDGNGGYNQCASSGTRFRPVYSSIATSLLSRPVHRQTTLSSRNSSLAVGFFRKLNGEHSCR